MKRSGRQTLMFLGMTSCLFIVVYFSAVFVWNPATTTAMAMTTTSRLKTPQAEPRKIISDGCGLADTAEPNWVNYTEEDRSYLRRIRTCSARFEKRDNEALRKHLNLTKLMCAVNISDFRSIVSRYRKIWFIGDSVMRQMYFVMMCMTDDAYHKDFLHTAKLKEERPMWTATFPLTNFTADNSTITTNIQTNDTANRTWLHYSMFGPNWHRDNKGLFKHFPIAMRNATREDAIIVNAGHHYDFGKVKLLKEALSYVTKMSQLTEARVFFVETADEQWRTSNGMFEGKFMFRGQCAPLTPSQLLGLGVPNEEDLRKANSTGWIVKRASRPTFEHFGEAYPYMFDGNKSIVPAYNASSCRPYCLPADWRSKVALPLLQSNVSRVHIVPIWKQMVARKLMRTKDHGDCTHGAVDSVIEMNRQLLRAMNQPRPDV
jgi:hypothetical protein